MIFTYVTAFNEQSDLDYLNNLKTLFEQSGGNFYFVELFADVKTRLERNVTPHRLESKLSKNNIEWSNNDLIETMNKYRLNTFDEETICDNHLKIDNTNLQPDEVAQQIIDYFNLDIIKTDKEEVNKL